MRWILLEEVVEILPRQSAVTRSRVPSAPYSPEVLILEMMAQTGGLLLGAESDYRQDIVFGKVEKTSFEGPFKPGATLEIRAVCEDPRPEGAWFQAEVVSDGVKCAEGRFFLVNAGELVPGRPSSITFPESFLNHFDVRAKAARSGAADGGRS